MLKEWSRESLWVALCSRLQNSDQFQQFPYFTSFLLQAEIQDFEETQITIAVKNDLIKDFIKENFFGTLVDELSIILKRPVSVQFEIDKLFEPKIPKIPNIYAVKGGSPSPQFQEAEFNKSAKLEAHAKFGVYVAPTAEEQFLKGKTLKKQLLDGNIKADLNFDLFVQGSSNQNVYTASMNVADRPGQSVANPLIIFGPTGLGKTHLLHAIGNYSLDNETCKRASYITSEELLNHFVSSIGSGNLNPLMKYADLDLLLIDDIQFIARGKETQVHLMELIQILVQRGKQIVISCDQSPTDVRCAKNSRLHQGLIRHFDQGITIDVERPDQSTRYEILKQKAEQAAGRQDYFPSEIIEFISQRYTSNVRELEGIILKLFAYKNIMKREISLDVARVILGDVRRNLHRKISIDNILELVASEYKMTPALIISQSRKKEVMVPRKVSMYLARALTDNSLHTIGLHFNKDYSTVQYCVRALMKSLVRDPQLNTQVENLKAQLRQGS